jgi:hypothetical protein
VDQRSSRKKQFFVEALEIKYLCLRQSSGWSQGKHCQDQEDAPMILGALIQEETVEHAANTRSHTATRTLPAPASTSKL